MIPFSREEREWFLRNLALGLVEYLGAKGPPVNVEEILEHPPAVYDQDFGVVEMMTNIWDATFARPINQRGNIFVRVDLRSEDRRYALAREMLNALITSKHGRAMGLPDLLMPHLKESGAYFARHLLMPDHLMVSYGEKARGQVELAEDFQVPMAIAAVRRAEL